MVNSPLIRPYLLGGTLGGGRLTSHDIGIWGHGGFFFEGEKLSELVFVEVFFKRSFCCDVFCWRISFAASQGMGISQITFVCLS